jgi:hypothetical protein
VQIFATDLRRTRHLKPHAAASAKLELAYLQERLNEFFTNKWQLPSKPTNKKNLCVLQHNFLKINQIYMTLFTIANQKDFCY